MVADPNVVEKKPDAEEEAAKDEDAYALTSPSDASAAPPINSVDSKYV
jgi:hypothetical protein